MDNSNELSGLEVSEKLLAAARNATRICLKAEPSDRAVVIFDGSTRLVAAAFRGAFAEIGTSASFFNVDELGTRPLAKFPPEVFRALGEATISALAVTTNRGELSARKDLLDFISSHSLRHAHMPSISADIFRDALAMDYNEVSRFIDHLVGIIESSSSLVMTSAGGTNLEFGYTTPVPLEKLDGLINAGRWQNLPSGQILIYPKSANGIFVADRSIGDWFEHKYDVVAHPVTFEFEGGVVRALHCDDRRFERDLLLFVRSSDNSGRISELVIGANLGLTQNHASALFDGYRPGASLSIGALPTHNLGWNAATFLPIVGKQNSLVVGGREIMSGDRFAADILAAAGVSVGG
jgi:hypothetical protein